METSHQDPDFQLSPNEVQLLMHAARVERAQAIRSFLVSLFRWRRKPHRWSPATPGKAVALSLNGCG